MENSEIFALADAAGKAAAAAKVPVPMIVGAGAILVNGERVLDRSYVEADGACGFAWVVVPGNSSFGKYLKRERGARKGYPSGIHLWISDYDQSMARKEAYARAFADVARGAGVDAYAGSRMD